MGKLSFGYFNPVLFDEAAGSGGGTGGQPGQPAGNNGDGAGDPKKPDNGDDKGKKPDEKKPEEKKFSQADVDTIIAERLEREKKKTEAATETARKKAEEDALTKNAEWQKLAETRASELEKLNKQVADHEPIKVKADRYEKVLNSYAKAQVEALPKPIQELVGKMDPADQLEWLTAHAKELGVKLPNGIPETPDPDAKTNTAEKEAARKTFATQVKRMF